MIVRTREDHQAFIRTVATAIRVGFDLEATSLDPREAKIVGFSAAMWDRGGVRTWYVPCVIEDGQDFWASTLQWLVRTVPLVGHGIKYDRAVLHARGFKLTREFGDTLLVGWLLERGLGGKRGHKLKPFAEAYLGVQQADTFEDVVKGRNAAEVPVEELAPYAERDALYTLLLWELWEPELRAKNLWKVYETLERPMIDVLRRMEDAGVGIDTEYLRAELGPLQEEGYRLADEFMWATGLTPTQTKALAEKMVADGHWNLPTTKKGNYSANNDALEVQAETAPTEYGRKIARLRLDYMRADKLRRTFIPRLLSLTDPDGRLRGDYRQHGTETGRLASASPILTLPKPVPGLPNLRHSVRARDGYVLVGADYSQLEPRILAHFSQDPLLCRIFREGLDFYQTVADQMSLTRTQAKPVALGLYYGMWVKKLAATLGCSIEEAKAYDHQYWEALSGARDFRRGWVAACRRAGYAPSLLGRRRSVDGWDGDFSARMQAERIAVNTPIQSSAADIMKTAMLALDRRWAGQPARIIAQVHDELVCEVRKDFVEEAKKDLQECMECSTSLRVPLVAKPKVGMTWAELK